MYEIDLHDDEIPEDMTREEAEDTIRFIRDGYGAARALEPVTEEDVERMWQKFLVLMQDEPNNPFPAPDARTK